MNTKDNWHLSLSDDQRYDLHALLDFVTEIRDNHGRRGTSHLRYAAEDILNSLVTITPDDPK